MSEQSESLEEQLDELLRFVFRNGPCQGCNLQRSETTGLIDYMNMGVRPALAPCSLCLCVPVGTPALTSTEPSP